MILITLSTGGSLAEEVHHVTVPLVSRRSCDRVYRRVGARLGSDIMCAGYRTGGKDSCQVIPANTERRTNDALMFSHRRRQWTNIKPAMGQRLAIWYSGFLRAPPL